MPPDSLVAWTEYAGLVVGLVTAIRALWSGGSTLRYRATLLERQVNAGSAS